MAWRFASGATRSSSSCSSAPGAPIAARLPLGLLNAPKRVARRAPRPHGDGMSRKRSHHQHGTPSRPRFWGKHAVSAALDNPARKVLRAWATPDSAAFMNFPKEVAVTLADVADLGRL